MRLSVLAAVCLAATAMAGCASAHPWAEEVTLVPRKGRFERAVKRAACDPRTWATAAGAVVFGLTDLDDNVSDWASRETPFFDSIKNARDVGGYFKEANLWASRTTALATPSGTRLGPWLANKAKGGAVQLAATASVGGVTDVLKAWTQRERPDGSSDRSFPSGTTSVAAAHAAVTRRNLDRMQIPRGAKTVGKVTVDSFAAIAGWSRVEAGRHYPSDVLAGYSIGNFLALVIHDTWVGPPYPKRRGVRVGLQPAKGGAMLSVSGEF